MGNNLGLSARAGAASSRTGALEGLGLAQAVGVRWTTPLKVCQPCIRVGMTNGQDAGRSVRSFGPDWDAAIEFGIDVTLLLANAKLSPAQRVAQMDELNRFAAEVQQRTVPAFLREAMAAHELTEKQLALDPGS